MSDQPSREQLEALKAFAVRNGRTWKSKLREKWMTGNYSRSDDSALLQQVRNHFGPSWLVSYRPGTYIVPKHQRCRLEDM